MNRKKEIYFLKRRKERQRKEYRKRNDIEIYKRMKKERKT